MIMRCDCTAFLPPPKQISGLHVEGPVCLPATQSGFFSYHPLLTLIDAYSLGPVSITNLYRSLNKAGLKVIAPCVTSPYQYSGVHFHRSAQDKPKRNPVSCCQTENHIFDKARADQGLNYLYQLSARWRQIL